MPALLPNNSSHLCTSSLHLSNISNTEAITAIAFKLCMFLFKQTQDVCALNFLSDKGSSEITAHRCFVAFLEMGFVVFYFYKKKEGRKHVSVRFCLSPSWHVEQRHGSSSAVGFGLASRGEGVLVVYGNNAQCFLLKNICHKLGSVCSVFLHVILRYSLVHIVVVFRMLADRIIIIVTHVHLFIQKKVPPQSKPINLQSHEN